MLLLVELCDAHQAPFERRVGKARFEAFVERSLELHSI